MNLPPCFTDKEAKRVLKQLCAENRVDAELLEELCGLLHDFTGKQRKDGLNDQLSIIIDRFLDRTKE